MIKLFHCCVFACLSYQDSQTRWKCRINLAKNSNIYWNIQQGAWRWLITNSDGQGDFITFTLSSLCGRPMWFTRVKYVKTACFSSRACGAGNFTCTALHKHSRKMYFEYYGIRQTISCWQKRQKWKTINQPVINECVQKETERKYITVPESVPACHSTWISMEHTHPYSHYLS